MAVAPYRIDVGDGDFEREVIQRSHERAGGGGLLGGLVRPLSRPRPDPRAAGRRARRRASCWRSWTSTGPPRWRGRFGVRSIPLVLGFRDGEPVAEFLGAQPEPAVRKFLAKLLPTEADRLAAEGDELAAGGHENAAEDALPRRPRAGDAPRARAARSRADARGTRRVRRGARAARARDGRRRRREGRGAPRGGAAHARHAPGADPAALRAARRARPRRRSRRGSPWAAPWPPRGDYEAALAELLAVVERDPELDEQAARRAMLDVFEVLGRDHPLTLEFRSELARALFSERGAAAARLPAPADLPGRAAACPVVQLFGRLEDGRALPGRGRPLPPVLLRAAPRPPAPLAAEAGARVTPSALRDLAGRALRARRAARFPRDGAAAARAPRARGACAPSRRTCASPTAT